MKQYILITGASSGIGYEMAQQLAALKYNLILTARSEDKLAAMQQELSPKYGITVQYIAKDLSKTEQAIQLFNDIKSANYQVSHLVNNAGFGVYGGDGGRRKLPDLFRTRRFGAHETRIAGKGD